MAFLVDKSVTTIFLMLLTAAGYGQSADSLKQVRRVYVGSLGTLEGAADLKRELVHRLQGSKGFTVVDSPGRADAVLDGKAELWVRGYHSLSPRARTNSSYAEPIYGGYLSVKLHGKDDEILWSYFADPKKVSVRDLRHDLTNEVASQLIQDRDLESEPPPVQSRANDEPAALRGAGATFPFPLYQEWFQSFHARHPAWTFGYTPQGSDAGIVQLGAGSIDFAGSDIPPAAIKDRLTISHDAFPSVGGAVVVIYNLPRFTGELRLTPDLIAGIFSGAIRKWNDPALSALNQSLPDAPIATVHRSDGSGTTYAFTEYLSKVNADWSKKAGTGARIEWANGTGASGSDGVVQSVASTSYSIGYVEFIYAFAHHLNFAAVRNLAGRFVAADLLSIMAAANGAGSKEEYLDLSISNSPEINAYPISTFSWLVVRTDLEPSKRMAMTTFLMWMLTSGQRQCSALGYAPLPKNLLDRELSAVRKLK